MMTYPENLIASALEARENAFAPFSGFLVGAALLSKDGAVFTGCNVESATYGLTMCAERVAIFSAVSQGVREFDSIAVVTGADRLTPPCGACRQVIWELCGNISVVLANLGGLRETFEMRELLPNAFDKRFLA